MPIYEYHCPQCRGTFQRLVRGFTDPADLACPRCQSTAVSRVMSRVTQLRGEAALTDRLTQTDPFAGVDEHNPAAVARWAKQLGHQIGENAGADWDEMVDEMIDEERADSAAGNTHRDDTDLGWA